MNLTPYFLYNFDLNMFVFFLVMYIAYLTGKFRIIHSSVEFFHIKRNIFPPNFNGIFAHFVGDIDSPLNQAKRNFYINFWLIISGYIYFNKSFLPADRKLFLLFF